jgi:hypothetical protein
MIPEPKFFRKKSFLTLRTGTNKQAPQEFYPLGKPPPNTPLPGFNVIKLFFF